ncbi:MAG TPA: ATP synthase subunit I [Polyangia bacterium]|nr:ATP synthase subunit I [Polyangia bacterium]
MEAVTELHNIQRLNLVLGAAAVAVAGLLWGGPGMLSAGVGAALSVANFWVLRRLGARAVAKVETGATTGQALLLVASLSIKMLLLFGLVWVAIRRIGLPVFPFTLGFSVFVVSSVFGGLYLGPRGLKVPPAAPPTSTDQPRSNES